MMAPTTADVFKWEHLPFPKSLPQFQKLFPNNDACARYLEGARWPRGFECPHCGTKGEPFRFEARPGVLRCRHCRRDTSLTANTVMERTHSDLTTWFWAAYLVSSFTDGFSATQFQRQLGLTRYETAFQMLHKLRAGMVRSDRNRRFYPFNAFRSLLGIGANGESPTYAELYSGKWHHPTVSGHG